LDLSQAVNEWNAFCTTQHPNYRYISFEGLEGRGPDCTIPLPEASAEWLVSGPEYHLAHVNPQTSLVDIAKGWEESWSTIANILEQGQYRVIALVREPSEAPGISGDGDLLVVERDDTNAPHHVYFGRSVNRVSVRAGGSGGSGEVLSTEEAIQGGWLIEVDALQAVIDPQYYVGALHHAEKQLGIYRLLQK